MKLAVFVLCIFAFSANLAVADDIAGVKKLEIELWEAWHHLDVEKWNQLTAPDYVWSDGKQMRGYDAVRKQFSMGKLEEYKTTNMQAVRVSPDVIVLSYRALLKGVYNKKSFQSNVAECSVWAKRNGKWRSIMLQEGEASDQETQITPP